MPDSPPADRVAAIVRELIDAADALMTAMYNSDLEAGWRRQRDRWYAACAAAEPFANPAGDADA
jgi:hypothetical protein